MEPMSKQGHGENRLKQASQNGLGHERRQLKDMPQASSQRNAIQKRLHEKM